MSINLLQTVQQNLGYSPLQKIDANTQEVVIDKNEPKEKKFGQAAIPAVLIALYKYGLPDEGAKAILDANLDSDWTDFIFSDQKEKIIEEISAYSGHTDSFTIPKLNAIAEEAIRIIREQLTKGSIEDVKNILAASRNDVLPYLPASMQIGTLLNDNTIDDRTNKMDGPISSLMHAIGGSFSGSDSDETTIPK